MLNKIREKKKRVSIEMKMPLQCFNTRFLLSGQVTHYFEHTIIYFIAYSKRTCQTILCEISSSRKNRTEKNIWANIVPTYLQINENKMTLKSSDTFSQNYHSSLKFQGWIICGCSSKMKNHSQLVKIVKYLFCRFVMVLAFLHAQWFMFLWMCVGCAVFILLAVRLHHFQ